MGCGDIDSGNGSKMPDHEGKLRRRTQIRERIDVNAVRRKDTCRKLREFL